MNETESWWASCEKSHSVAGHGVVRDTIGLDFKARLGEVHNLIDAYELKHAGMLLDQLKSEHLPLPWKSVLMVLAAQHELYSGRYQNLEHIKSGLTTLADTLVDSDSPTSARALHTLGVALLRSNEPGDAERVLFDALERNGNRASNLRILDTLAQCLMWQGAWIEARRTFLYVSDKRDEAGDTLGRAITLGSLSLLETLRGDARAALEAARTALNMPNLPLLTQLRVINLYMKASLDAGNIDTARFVERISVQLLEDPSISGHYLKGFCAINLARLHANDPTAANRWLDVADASFTAPENRALLEYWRARVQRPRDIASWYAEMRYLFKLASDPCEAELLTHLYLAELYESKGSREHVARHLNASLDIALTANNEGWVVQVSKVFRTLEPDLFERRSLARYTGLGYETGGSPKHEYVTNIFCDLVSVTDRFQTLSASEVMSTVASVFELAVPMFSKYHVTPLQHHGDGLVAVCTGTGHEKRAVQFSSDLIARIRRIDQLRKTGMADRWGMSVRIGVASGQVVMGMMGSQLKREYLCIGASVNMAARLQTKAEPGELAVAEDTLKGAGIPLGLSTTTLKGFEGILGFVRMRP